MDNVLWRTRCYLMGPMENADGTPWRNKIKEDLKSTGIIFFDPYVKPFINEIREDANVRKDLRIAMEGEHYDDVAGHVKKVRSDDLRLCDLSDFGIAQINPQVPTFGTMEEIVWFVRCKKPLFIFVEGGKKKTPLWIMGMLPHKYIYDSLDDVIGMIKRIDTGDKKIDSTRWRLFKKEYR